MTYSNKDLLLSLTESEKVRQIGEALIQFGYTEKNLFELLKINELPNFRQRLKSLPVFLRRTGNENPLSILIKLFFLKQSVTFEKARDILPILDDLISVGLLQTIENQVFATVELSPFQNLIFVADWSERNNSDVNQVMSIAASSKTLAQMTIRRNYENVLDLGCGCGILSLRAAVHSQKVFATDCNERAVRMTRFNAQLNGFDNVICLKGDLFEPVAEEKFDLIFCNPPFVIAPNQDYAHSHSGLPADEFCRKLAQTAPKYLNENGYCQFLSNWACLKGKDWRERLKSWFQDNDCDVTIFHSHTESIEDYAMNRIQEMEIDETQVAQTFRHWMDYYESEQIEAIGFGIICLCRKSKKVNRFRLENLPPITGECGNSIELSFALQDFLAKNSDDKILLNAKLRYNPDLCWEQHLIFSKENNQISSVVLKITRGFCFKAEANQEIVEFVRKCDEKTTLREHLHKLAKTNKQDVKTFTPIFLRVVRGMIEKGFLIPT